MYCVKHVFDAAVVFQFNCTNTIAEQILESVTVLMDMAEAVSVWIQDGVCRLLNRSDKGPAPFIKNCVVTVEF